VAELIGSPSVGAGVTTVAVYRMGVTTGEHDAVRVTRVVSAAPGGGSVARGVADGAVAHAVVLLGRLRDDLGVAPSQPLGGAVGVLGRQQAYGNSP
jgi:hypothetical protein